MREPPFKEKSGRPRISIVSKIGTPLTIIALLLIIIASMAGYEFYRFRLSFSTFSEQTLPQVTVSAHLTALLNQLLFQTERLAGANSQVERRLAWNDINEQFKTIEIFYADLTENSKKSFPISHLELLKSTLTELNQYIEKRISFKKQLEIARRKLMSLERNLLFSIHEIVRLGTKADQTIMTDWIRSFQEIKDKAFEMIFFDNLYKARNAESHILQQLSLFDKLAADLSETSKMAVEPFMQELTSLVSGPGGIVHLAIEQITITSSTTGKSNFASSLVEEVSHAGTAHFMEMNIMTQRIIKNLSKRTTNRVKLLTILTITALIIAIIVFIYFRLALIGRLIRLNQTVMDKVAGRDVEIDCDGNDEISDIARSVHYFTSELEEAKARAEEANKAKSSFLAHMSHEIRTPLNAVIGFCALGLKEDTSDEIRNYFNKIEYSSQALLAIINEILDFSKIEAGALTLENIAFSLEEQMEQVVNVIGMKCDEKNVDFMLNMAPDTPDNLIGDPLRLGQILSNLLTNAVKFTNHGRIELLILHIESTKTSATIRFIVSDTGIGMTQKQKERLFSPFVQADSSITRRYGGTGLGMTITRMLTEKLNGTIDVKSEKDRGTTISLTIPFALSSQNSSIIEPEELKGVRIIIITEHADIAENITRQTQGLGCETVMLPDIQHALQNIERQSHTGSTTLLLTDRSTFNTHRVLLREVLGDNTAQHPKIGLIVLASTTAKTLPIERAVPPAFVCLRQPPTKGKLLRAIKTILDGEDDPKNREKQTDLVNKKNILSGKRILLVEDNLINQQIAQKILENEEMRVTIAEHGMEALNLLNAKNANFDLVLMDIQMPVMDGYTATAEIRSMKYNKRAEIPIIAMTAHAMSEDYKKCIEVGMNGYVSKPIDLDELFSTLARHLK